MVSDAANVENWDGFVFVHHSQFVAVHQIDRMPLVDDENYDAVGGAAADDDGDFVFAAAEIGALVVLVAVAALAAVVPVVVVVVHSEIVHFGLTHLSWICFFFCDHDSYSRSLVAAFAWCYCFEHHYPICLWNR